MNLDAALSDPKPRPSGGRAPMAPDCSLPWPLPVSGEQWSAWLLAATSPQIAEETPPGLWDGLTWLARREGYTVQRAPCRPAASLTNWESRQIQVGDDLPIDEAVRALQHELGHVLADGQEFHPPGSTTAGCRGIQKLVADSIAFIATTRLGMDASSYQWPYVANWAGSDPRARPVAIIQAVGTRIINAAARMIAHLDITVFGIPPQPAATAHRQLGSERPALDPPPPPVREVLKAVNRFYQSQLRRSWVPRYLISRGLDQATAARWRIGYAPAGWTTLLSHLRNLGHDDGAIQAAGLARLSSRGTLIDHFRDRAMLAIRGEHSEIVGFIGRARPNAGPRTPKYLNSPDSPVFKKGAVLFGLHEARDQLADGAVPVLVEGPFDAIAMSAADRERYAAVAPCGTAFTNGQAEALARAADLRKTGVLVALDGDQAGQKASIKAYEILRTYTAKTDAVRLPPGRDPAEILQNDGPASLCAALQQTKPLARIVVDAHIDQWADRLDHAEGQLGVMRSVATRIARSLPPEAVEAIRCITGGRPLTAPEDPPGSITSPELSAIARILPSEAITQILRTADRTSHECFEVITAVASVVAEDLGSPKDVTRNERGYHPASRATEVPVRLTASGFPSAAMPTAATNRSSSALSAHWRHPSARRAMWRPEVARRAGPGPSSIVT